MEAIDDKTVKNIENELENSKNLSFKLKNGRLITQSEIFLYGKIDIENNKDKSLLESFENKIWDWTQWNHIAYSNVNYETGDVIRDENKQCFLRYSIVDLIKWIKYNLLLINNPKNIIIYKIPKNCL
jgi:hypothetical protein